MLLASRRAKILHKIEKSKLSHSRGKNCSTFFRFYPTLKGMGSWMEIVDNIIFDLVFEDLYFQNHIEY